MSKALMCDRCHTTFDPASMDHDKKMIKFRNPIVYSSTGMDDKRELSVIDGTVFTYMGRDDYADLCPHCAERFLAFLWKEPLAENTPPNTEKDGV